MQQLFFKKFHGLLQQVHAGLPIIGKKEWERKRADINLSFIVRKSHLTTFFSFCFDRKSLFVLSQLTETVILFLSNWRPDFLPETDALLTQSLLGVLKWANHGLFFVYFRSSSNKQYNFFTTNQCEKCYVHPVYRAGIQTHNLSNMICLP